MARRLGFIFAGTLLLLGALPPEAPARPFVPAETAPPTPAWEFRAFWIATVKNIDWPSRPGLSTAEQKAELITLLDRAAQLRLNAVMLQVRPAADALYASKLEPWSEFISGTMGQAPAPYYDPLAFAVESAHVRGLELHAWFNPFRARHGGHRAPASASHVTRAQPRLVRTYGDQIWLDPGEAEAREHSHQVILDVVRRYDIDAVHFDDYFYPYPIKNEQKKIIDFPDGVSWKKYLATGGKLSREDWRRDNVDRFVRRLHDSIRAAKPYVKFGISPFGIWRPGFPAGVKGFDAYAGLYADSKKWLGEGWVDYLAPQLYWPIDAKQQSYPTLLQWWTQQNPLGRSLFAGNDVYSVGGSRSAAEIVNQIQLTRKQPGAMGNIFWSGKLLLQNRGGIVDALAREVYREPALIPAMPWLGPKALRPPKLGAREGDGGSSLEVTWSPTADDQVRWWLLQWKVGVDWTTQILPGGTGRMLLQRSGPVDAIALRAVGRLGNLSAVVGMGREAPGGSAGSPAVKASP